MKYLRAFGAAALLALGGCGGGGEGAAAPAAPGEDTYRKFCISCHLSGAAGAPKLGDAAAWAPRVEQGIDVLVRHTIDGLPPGMPAKGLCLQCTDEQLRDAVEYMVGQSR